jgi:CubicO group peptidase (beta-lactamase class C family)
MAVFQPVWEAVLSFSSGLLLLLLMSVVNPADAKERVLRTGKPEEAGMSAVRLDQAGRILEQETSSGQVLAASILVARHGIVVLHRGSGKQSPEASGPPARPDTIYLLASITKPVTACALMLLVERGMVGLSDPVQKYLPEFQGPERDKVRVQDLLSHVSGLPDMLPENLELRKAHAPLSEFVRRSMTTPLLFAPRTSFSYQSMGILLAAEIVERLTKTPLREFLKREFFDPLGMNNTMLGLGGRTIDQTAWCQGAPSYETSPADTERFGANSRYWRDMGHPWGGMHSTVNDLAVFLQMFLNRGAYAGKRVLAPATVEAMISDQNPKLGTPWGLGWAMKRSHVWNYFGDLSSNRTFGHVGATGTVAWADPERDLLCVILTTRPASQDNGSLLNRVSNVVQSAIETQP